MGDESKEIVLANSALTVDDLIRHVELVNEAVNRVMKKDVHYGIIPNTPKPCLYKAGAEKLLVLFQLAPEYEIKHTDLPNGHREYQATCTLRHRATGTFAANSTKVCSTMESKYRYRASMEDTGIPVPHAYWAEKDKDKRDQSLLGGPGRFPKKGDDGKWTIWQKVGQKEHDNPADYYNTCCAMAQVRSLRSAVLNVSAASDIFDIDIEKEDPGVGQRPEKDELPGYNPSLAQEEDHRKEASHRRQETPTEAASQPQPAPPISEATPDLKYQQWEGWLNGVEVNGKKATAYINGERIWTTNTPLMVLMQSCDKQKVKVRVEKMTSKNSPTGFSYCILGLEPASMQDDLNMETETYEPGSEG